MKNNKRVPVIFGEVLFDCFPNNERILGGAPFNVAWHLQALGDQPYFISRVGCDALGDEIKLAMQNWGMSLFGLQSDTMHSTGKVEVKFVDNEPQYTIMSDVAYDFIEPLPTLGPVVPSLIYHGTLALRGVRSRRTFDDLVKKLNVPVFMDVNLRQPWWDKLEVLQWMKAATWLKLNEDELYLLQGKGDVKALMSRCLHENELALLIVTLGEKGAVALTHEDEFLVIEPERQARVVDTVGAGDAFTAVLLHAISQDCPLSRSLQKAQQFASAIVGHRGATPHDKHFYTPFVD